MKVPQAALEATQAPHPYGQTGRYRTCMASCPECGLPGVPLIYGMPGPEAMDAANDGELALGGCVMDEFPANLRCPNGHEWREPETAQWRARVRR